MGEFAKLKPKIALILPICTRKSPFLGAFFVISAFVSKFLPFDSKILPFDSNLLKLFARHNARVFKPS